MERCVLLPFFGQLSLLPLELLESHACTRKCRDSMVQKWKTSIYYLAHNVVYSTYDQRTESFSSVKQAAIHTHSIDTYGGLLANFGERVNFELCGAFWGFIR